MPVGEWTMAQKFVAATAFFQLLSVLLNLLPVPPLDGFQMIFPVPARRAPRKIVAGPFGWMAMLVLFVLIWRGPLFKWMCILMAHLCTAWESTFTPYSWRQRMR